MPDKRPSKPKRRVRPSETIRERAIKSAHEPQKPRRIRKTAGVVTKPIKAAGRVGKKEYYLPMPDTKIGQFLNKRRSVIPRYFRESWQELKEVTWPGRKETVQLTFAVFIFAIVFGLLVAVTDYGLDKVFKRILLK